MLPEYVSVDCPPSATSLYLSGAPEQSVGVQKKYGINGTLSDTLPCKGEKRVITKWTKWPTSKTHFVGYHIMPRLNHCSA